MTKKLLYVFAFSAGITCFTAKNAITKVSESIFFCDTNAPTGVQVSEIKLTSVTVSWAPDADTPDHIIRYRPVGSTVWYIASNIPSGQNNYSLTGLLPCTAYEVQVAKICTTQGVWSMSAIFTTTLNYCQSASVNTDLMHISNVTVTATGAAAQMISNSGSSNYTDYRTDVNRRIKFYLGSTGNKLSVSTTWTGTPEPVTVTAWLDLNTNGVFEDNERILVANNVSSAMPVVSTFNIPELYALPGFVMNGCGVSMRVISSKTIPASACGTYTYGEVEDYGVDFVISTLAVDETNQFSLPVIYPNPASDMIHISGVSKSATFEIYNMVGQRVSEGKMVDQKVSVQGLLKGEYVIGIKDKETISRVKFIKN
jgi:hypothetical protein